MKYESEVKNPLVPKNSAESEFKNKKILIMGLGLLGGGIATVKFFAKKGAKLTITDTRPEPELKPALKILNKIKDIHYVLGEHRQKDFINSDLIVKNPGVKPDSLFLKIARDHHVPITSDIGIFFKSCPGHIIGVTGTRGKSTTAYLIWRFLKEGFDQKNSPKVFLGGNIRKSVLEFLPIIKKKDWVILELSSFQLYDLAPEKQSPEIAVLTNIFPDHLNWHENFKEYLKSKSSIFSFQNGNNYLFLGSNDRLGRKLAKNAKSKVVLITSDLPKKLEKIVTKNLGEHYKNSVSLAIAVAKHFGVGDNKILKALKNFKGLEGRQEIIKTSQGITWVNDTTSTMPEATIAALNRFGNLADKIKGRLILIAGGQDKKLDFKKMALAIKKYVSVLILLPGTATDKLKNYLKPAGFKNKNITEANSMLKAVKDAKRLVRKKDFVILSPGAASFGLFKNEFDRGEKFVEVVNRLAGRKMPVASH